MYDIEIKIGKYELTVMKIKIGYVLFQLRIRPSERLSFAYLCNIQLRKLLSVLNVGYHEQLRDFLLV